MRAKLFICLCLIVFSVYVNAQNDEFSLNLKDVDIHTLIETVADATGKNFIVDPRVTGNISVITSTPMKASQVYDVFLSILKVNGYAAVPSGNVIKIVPNLSAKEDGLESQIREKAINGDGQLTRILQVSIVDPVSVVQTLLPLMPQHAFLAAVKESKTIILSDTASNVNRLALMIKEIDRSDTHNIEVVTLNYAIAEDLILPINTLISNLMIGRTVSSVPLVADSRSNSIIIGGDPELRNQLKVLIRNLDVPNPPRKDGETEVIYLHYALAKDLVETLTGVGNKKDEKADQSKTLDSTQKDFDIRANTATNALIITAPAEIMASIKDVIKKLDIRRAQVHIEAIIVEVNYDKQQNVGVEWHTKLVNNGVAVTSSPATLGSMLSAAGKGLSVGYMVGSELRALMNAFASDNNVNVLSTPSLVTMDNEEANMIVGQNIPILSGSFTAVAGQAGNVGSTYVRQDVGVKLKVTPQINEGNVIKLKVKQEVSSVDNTVIPPAGSNPGPTLNKREIDTSVLVDDGKILVLGGLISDDVEVTVDKVPVLGDLPFIGHAFQNNVTSNIKKNLMVFLRPVIVRDPDKAALVTNDRYNELRNLQQQSAKRGLLLMPNEHESVLPVLTPENASNMATVPVIK